MYPGIRKYPKQWFINDDIWELKFVRKMPFCSEEDDIRGLNDPGTMTIYILQKLSRKETLETFFHEIIHALEFSYDLPEKNEYTYREIHSYIHGMEYNLARFFVQNFEQLFVLFFGDP